MRVLHVYKSYYPDTVGGIEQVLAQLGRGLAANQIESRIFTLSPQAKPAVLSMPEGEVHRSKQTFEIASNNVSLAAFGDFRRHLSWADVVHYQFPWPFGDLLHVTSGVSKPSVVTYQSDIVRQKWLMHAYRPLMERFLSSVDLIVATSPQYRASSEVLAQVSTPVEVIPNGIDEASYPVPSQISLDQWRARFGDGFFLFVGVLRYYKGLRTLLEAAFGFEGRIVIAGSGPEQSELERIIREKRLSNVVLLGHVSDEDKISLMRLSRAFVFPSHLRSEAFGMSLVEAAMASCALISCEIGTGTTYINQHGVTGLAVSPADADALRDAMRRLMAAPDEARSFGSAARARFECLFTARHMAGAYEDVYRRLSARR